MESKYQKPAELAMLDFFNFPYIHLFRMHACMPQHACEGQRTTCKGEFSLLPCRLQGSKSSPQAW